MQIARTTTWPCVDWSTGPCPDFVVTCCYIQEKLHPTSWLFGCWTGRGAPLSWTKPAFFSRASCIMIVLSMFSCTQICGPCIWHHMTINGRERLIWAETASMITHYCTTYRTHFHKCVSDWSILQSKHVTCFAFTCWCRTSRISILK